MNESISRSAGAAWGQELPPEQMDRIIRSIGRVPRQRSTLYGEPSPQQVERSYGAPPVEEPRNPPVSEAGLKAPPRLVRPGLVGARAR
jgi:FO synthase